MSRVFTYTCGCSLLLEDSTDDVTEITFCEEHAPSISNPEVSWPWSRSTWRMTWDSGTIGTSSSASAFVVPKNWNIEIDNIDNAYPRIRAK